MNMEWSVFCQDTLTNEAVPGCFGKNGDVTYLDWMFSAWGWTVSISLTALLLALLAGAAVGMARTLPHSPWLARLAHAWVEVFRNIPLLVQIFIWYYVFPALFPALKGAPSFALAVLALGLFTSARIAEQVRAGLQALPRGQRLAGMALGLTTAQYYRLVLLPQAGRIIIPPLANESMNIFKNSAVAFAVSVPELTQFAMQAGEETARPVEVYLAVTALYVISALAVNAVMVFIEKKTRVPGLIAAGAGC